MDFVMEKVHNIEVMGVNMLAIEEMIKNMEKENIFDQKELFIQVLL